MTDRTPDITVLTTLIAAAEKTVADAQDGVMLAASDLARVVGPLATAHRLAELALEFADLAEQEKLSR